MPTVLATSLWLRTKSASNRIHHHHSRHHHHRCHRHLQCSPMKCGMIGMIAAPQRGGARRKAWGASMKQRGHQARASTNGVGESSSGQQRLLSLKKRDILTRLSTGVLFVLLVSQLFAKKRILATHLNSYEFGCYMILLLLLNVPAKVCLLFNLPDTCY